MHAKRRRTPVRSTLAVAIVALAAAAIFAAVATARSSAAPANTAPPQISGTERSGSTLTASTGTWSNTPTSYTYQWQRCATDGTSCGDIVGATKQTYTLASDDVTHTVRVVVTAVNADGKASANSDPTGVISSSGGPSNTVKPTVTGTAAVGQELRSTIGTWTPAPTSSSRQWQRCAGDGTACLNITGATGVSYGVRLADVGHRLRVLVTAHTSGGAASAVSNPTAVVAATPGQTTTVTTPGVTVTTPGNKPPTLAFLSLRRVGMRYVARFRVCDDTSARVRITERDNKARALSATRHFVVPACGTYSRSWKPAARFRTHGRYVVTLRASDSSGALSRLVSRSIVNR